MSQKIGNGQDCREEWLQGTAAGFVTRLFNAWTGNGLPPAPLARVMVGTCAALLAAENGRGAAIAFLDDLRAQIEADTERGENPHRPN